MAGLLELRRIAPDREWRLIEVNCTLVAAMEPKAEIMALMFPAVTVVRSPIVPEPRCVQLPPLPASHTCSSAS